MTSVALVKAPVKTPCPPETGHTQIPTAQTTLPDCFEDHHAPLSVMNLFTEWTRAADATDNGVTVINRQRQRYSTATVDRAVKWLKSHHLLFLVERGSGRGNGNRYFVRWSFVHETVSARQKTVNHPEHAKTLSSNTFARVEAFKLLEEKLISKKHSLNKFKTSHDVSLVGNSKRETFATANKQQRQLRNEKATRWAIARLREATADEDALTAAARGIRKALKTGRVWIGPEFNRLVAQLADDLRDLGGEESWPETRRDVFSYTGYHAQQAALDVLDRRANEAEYQAQCRAMKHEREEAIHDPLLAGFSCRKEAIVEVVPKVGATEELEKMLVQAFDRVNDSSKFGEPCTLPEPATQPKPGKSGYEQIHEERATVAGDLSQMLQEEGAVHISDLIRREVATAGAVVNSGKRERRQPGGAYQRAGNHHSGAKRATPKQGRGEHPATVYAADPVNVGEMMSGYLEKLRGGGDEVERNDKGN